MPGYAATILSIVFFGAINLFSLRIVGSYAWRTYENTKARPLSVVLRASLYAYLQEPRFNRYMNTSTESLRRLRAYFIPDGFS